MPQRLRLVVGMAALYAACDREVPQVIAGHIVPLHLAVGRVIRLHASRDCNGPYSEGRLTESGAFALRTASTQGGWLGEVTQEVALCIVNDGRGSLVWSSLHSGGATRIELECDLTKPEDDRCVEAFQFGHNKSLKPTALRAAA